MSFGYSFTDGQSNLPSAAVASYEYQSDQTYCRGSPTASSAFDISLLADIGTLSGPGGFVPVTDVGQYINGFAPPFTPFNQYQIIGGLAYPVYPFYISGIGSVQQGRNFGGFRPVLWVQKAVRRSNYLIITCTGTRFMPPGVYNVIYNANEEGVPYASGDHFSAWIVGQNGTRVEISVPGNTSGPDGSGISNGAPFWRNSFNSNTLLGNGVWWRPQIVTPQPAKTVLPSGIMVASYSVYDSFPLDQFINSITYEKIFSISVGGGGADLYSYPGFNPKATAGELLGMPPQWLDDLATDPGYTG